MNELRKKAQCKIDAFDFWDYIHEPPSATYYIINKDQSFIQHPNDHNYQSIGVHNTEFSPQDPEKIKNFEDEFSPKSPEELEDYANIFEKLLERFEKKDEFNS